MLNLDFNPALAAKTDFETAAILHSILLTIAKSEGLETDTVKPSKPDFHTYDKKRLERAFLLLLKSGILKAEKVEKINLLEVIKKTDFK